MATKNKRKKLATPLVAGLCLIVFVAASVAFCWAIVEKAKADVAAGFPLFFPNEGSPMLEGIEFSKATFVTLKFDDPYQDWGLRQWGNYRDEEAITRFINDENEKLWQSGYYDYLDGNASPAK